MAIRNQTQQQQPAQNSSKAAVGKAKTLGLLGDELVDRMRARNAGFGCVSAWRNPEWLSKVVAHDFDAACQPKAPEPNGRRVVRSEEGGQVAVQASGVPVSEALATVFADRVERSGGGDHYMVMEGDGTGYVLTRRGNSPVAIGFKGRSSRKAFGYRFENEEARAKYVAAWVDDQVKRITEQFDRKEATHTLQIGDVLVSSWGYEQTNVDFYEVTAVKGKIVEMRPLKKITTSNDGQWTGKATPIPGAFDDGAILCKRPDGQNNVSLNSFSTARPWNGCPQPWTSYA
ncbi:hypothetical protein KWH45_21040 [Xanthomonas campestris pv. mirabilis]|uniref:hypothetical protein n=1 Tax=Xanthomonas euvesicatoria TaxID=456327 RepID=UPI001C495474|nr:hypothetical protein [Xanthomonas euvesicatoria]MBV6855900.1 hypothetical protein [Xanthomonas campestris pv. mirabilis]